jgi:uncharacterized membrane protein
MKRHKRFLLAFALGALVVVLAQLLTLSIELRILAGANAFFASYLAMMFHFAHAAAPEDLRSHAEQTDEGVWLILLLAGVAVAASLTAIVLVLNGPGGGGTTGRLLSLASAPLGWAAIQTLAGFHYAHMFYQPPGPKTQGGLTFPGTQHPGPWDFLYFAFGVGMTAQVSDVVANSTRMRKVVLAHAVSSYFYNTIILALAVNAAMTAAG